MPQNLSCGEASPRVLSPVARRALFSSSFWLDLFWCNSFPLSLSVIPFQEVHDGFELDWVVFVHDLFYSLLTGFGEDGPAASHVLFNAGVLLAIYYKFTLEVVQEDCVLGEEDEDCLILPDG